MIEGMSQAIDKARETAIDRFGEADRLYRLWKAPVNPHAAELAAAKAAVMDLYADLPADQAAIDEGGRYQVEVSERHNQRTLTEDGLAKAFYKMQRIRTVEGNKIVRFNPFSVFSVTLEAIRKHLGEPFLDAIAPAERTGPRTYRVAARMPAAKAA